MTTTSQNKKEAIAASIQAAKTIMDLLYEADVFASSSFRQSPYDCAQSLLILLMQESEKLKEEN